MTARVIAEETFDPEDYTEELRAAPNNLAVGTKLWFENSSIRVWASSESPSSRPITRIGSG